MGKRSGVPDTAAEIAALSVEELEREIARVKSRLRLGTRSLVTKAFEKQLHLLERALAAR